MNTIRTHYPSYDVIVFQDEWDAHTKEIVLKRLGPFPESKFLTAREEKILFLLTEHLTYDNRKKIIDWVIHYIDQRLSSEIGESQRKPDIPPEKTLIREGLEFLDQVALGKFNKSFPLIETKQQFEILATLQKGSLSPNSTVGNIDWPKTLQKALFNKFAELIISAYYSHPTVWSEIGYGGPAYPRGYVRIEFGLSDPWEPKKADATFYGYGEEGKRHGE